MSHTTPVDVDLSKLAQWMKSIKWLLEKIQDEIDRALREKMSGQMFENGGGI